MAKRRITSVTKTAPSAPPPSRALADREIVPLQCFRVAGRRPGGGAPWGAEAERIGLIDKGGGMPCINLRQRNGSDRLVDCAEFARRGDAHALSERLSKPAVCLLAPAAVGQEAVQ